MSEYLGLIIGIFGACISLLLAIIGFFIIRLISHFDTMTDTVAILSKETTSSVNKLSNSVERLNLVVTSFEHEEMRRYTQVQETLKEHQEQIELVRTRLYDLSQHLSEIRTQGEIKNGWKFSKKD